MIYLDCLRIFFLFLINKNLSFENFTCIRVYFRIFAGLLFSVSLSLSFRIKHVYNSPINFLIYVQEERIKQQIIIHTQFNWNDVV